METKEPMSSESPGSPTTTEVKPIKKKCPEDFKFGKILGEGSYSTVYVAQEIATGKEFAIKVLEKRHMIKEKKVPQVQREKEVLSRLNHPFFVKLYFTFQDKEKLYFGLSFAKKGELLPYINKLGAFDETCTIFYSAEIISALEHLHSLGIIHRDLKPENILLDENMHIQITDFGTAKILNDGENKQGRNSFVGTAQYVSPELLTDKRACKSSDIWALGCIMYQLLSGLPPFRAGNEYQIFQKIIKLEYDFPSGFPSVPKDLVEKILLLDPTKRLGCEECGGFEALKNHPFYEGIDWDELPNTKPPELLPYLPATSSGGEEHRSKYKSDFTDNGVEEFDDKLLAGFGLSDDITSNKPTEKNFLGLTTSEVEERLQKQSLESPWHPFIENNLIIKTAILDKRKGLFAKRRQMILTEGPHLYYVDTANMVLKGQIPWTKELRAEAKSFKVFFVHTPIKTYYLEDHKGFSVDWVKKIQEVHQYYFGTSPSCHSPTNKMNKSIT